MAQPIRTCPKCQQPQLRCTKIRITLGANTRSFLCSHCSCSAEAPTRASAVFVPALVLVVFPLMVQLNPNYSWRDPTALGTNFWIFFALGVAYAAYIVRKVVVFEREVPAA